MGIWTHRKIHVIDSHTGGEPTRVVISGWPDPGHGDLAARCTHIAGDHDEFRAAVVEEPRGSDHLVGAILCEPTDRDCAAGVIFFNNVGYLGMCVHGTIGLVVTLNWLGRVGPGVHRIETPVGEISTELHENGEVTVRNVPSYRYAAGVSVEVAGHGEVTGDIAWGGNWFFLCDDHGQAIDATRTDLLTDFTWRIREGLERQGVTAKDGAVIDHIELFGPPSGDHADSRNFVLCPGKAYDRSPCGTGTSAKLACLAAAGKLNPGEIWRQESVIGSVFTGRFELDGDAVIPYVTGTAHVNAEATLLLDRDDPFCMGIEAR